MEGIRFKVDSGSIMAYWDRAYVRTDESPQDAIRDAIIDNLSTDIWVSVGEVRNHLAAWLDPEHWSEEWREQAGDEDPYEYVHGLLTAAKEDV
jgi:hypothetical protein